MKVFPNKRQVKHTSTVMEPSIPFPLLVKLVDTEVITNEKVGILYLLLEISLVLSQLESKNLSVETYGPSPEIMFTQIIDPNNWSKLQSRISCNFFHKTNHSVSICFRKQREDAARKRNSYSWSKSPMKSFNQNFKANQK